MQPSKNILLSFTPIEGISLQEVLQNQPPADINQQIANFESLIADYVKSSYVIALNSGTSAIHLGLIALGVKQGDEVLVSNFTYVASINPIFYQGAVPILIDSEQKSWNMDPDLLEKAVQSRISVGKKPKAILVVHSFGMPADMQRICNIANLYNIPILEDAAESFGSLYANKHTGTWGKIGVLSFNNNKVFTTYGGGALLTDDLEIATKVRYLSQQARADLPYYYHEDVGYNYRMSLLNALVGIAQWPTIELKIKKRRNDLQTYKIALQGMGVSFFQENANQYSNCWLTTIILPTNVSAQKLQQVLKDHGIESRRVWNPMHLQPINAGCLSFLNGVSEMLFERGLCLPTGNLSNEDIEHIVQTIRKYFRSINGK